jgi:hypothetical protein
MSSPFDYSAHAPLHVSVSRRYDTLPMCGRVASKQSTLCTNVVFVFINFHAAKISKQAETVVNRMFSVSVFQAGENVANVN